MDGQAEFDQRDFGSVPRGAGPGFFSNIISATGEGLARGAIHIGEAAASAGQLGVAMVEANPIIPRLFGRKEFEPGELVRPYEKAVRSSVTRTLGQLTPSPDTVGLAGQVLGGLGEILPPLLATKGNPSMLMSATANERQRYFEAQGVDRFTARRVALLEAAVMGAGAQLPAAFGTTLLQRVGTGAAGNLALGAGQRGLEAELLSEYPKVAGQFHALSVTELLIDALMGAIFGGVHHMRARDINDAASVLENHEHMTRDTAPGEPLDERSAAAHVDAMAQTMDALLYDDRPSVPALARVADGEYGPRQASEFADDAGGSPMRMFAQEMAALGHDPKPPLREPIPINMRASLDDLPAEAARAAPQRAQAAGATDGTPDPLFGVQGSQAARMALAERPEMLVPTGERDSDGVSIVRPASEVLREAGESVQKAEADSRAFDVAAACFLSGGENA